MDTAEIKGISLQYADSTVDTTYHIRDLVRGAIYRVDDLDEFLVLRSDSTILDTASTFGMRCGTYSHTITAFDSTFLTYEAVCRGNSGSGHTEVWCVVDGRLKMAAPFMSHENNPIYGGAYRVQHDFLRHPYRLGLVESLDSPAIEEFSTSESHWQRRYRLRFDTIGHFFHFDSVRLHEVPLRGESRVFSGDFPAIATLKTTAVYLDDQWYGLSSGMNSGPDAEKNFIRSRSKPKLSGKGRDGDFLWPR